MVQTSNSTIPAVQQHNFQLWQQRLSDCRAQLQGSQDTPAAAVYQEQRQSLLAVNEELLHLVGELFTRRIEAGFAELQAEWNQERKQLEEQLAYQALILDHIQDAVIAFDKDLMIMSWNNGAEKLYGYSVDEALGQNISNLLGTEITAEERRDAVGKLAGSGQYSTEVVQHTKKGDRICVESNTIPLRDPAGQVVGYITDNRDITARKKVEKEREQLLLDLEKERNLWQATVDSLLDPVTVCDARGQATYMNKTYERLLQMEIRQGLEMEQHSDYYRIYHPDGTPFASNDLPLQRAALENRDVRHVEMIQHSAAGDKYYLIWNASPLRDAGGSAIGAVAIGHDITAQRLAEIEQARLMEENQQQRELLEALLDYIPEGITIADAPDVQVRIISDYGRELIGLREDEIVGRPRTEWWKLFDPSGATLAPVEQMPLSRAIWNGEVITDEEWLLENARGERIPILCNAGPIRDRNEDIIGGILAWREIADRKRAEAALQESDERYRILLQAISISVWRTTPDGKIMLDASGNSIFDHAKSGEQADFSLSRFHPDDRVPVWKAWQKAIETRELFEIDHRLLSKEGRYRWLHSRAVPRLNAAGEVIEWIGISVDITDRKEAEQAVQEYSEQLEKRVRERMEELVHLQRRLVDNMEAERLWVSQELHDGPMQEIYSLLYELSSLDDGPDGSDWRAEITSIKDKLKQINGDLRTVAWELRPTSLTPFGLEKAIREHGERFDQEHPELQITLNLMEDGTLLSEHVRLSLFRIYQTALTNVIRHAQAKNISVDFSFDEDYVILEIQDDGKGFAVPKRLRTLARQGHFGLAGAVERAEAIGGKLEVESEPGKGTRLRVIALVRKETETSQ